MESERPYQWSVLVERGDLTRFLPDAKWMRIMSRTEKSDRRKHPRTEGESYASLEVIGLLANDQAFGVVIDVSRSGVCVRTPQPPYLAQNAKVRMDIGGEMLTLDAQVMRVERIGNSEAWDVGLRFDGLSSAQERFFARFLKARAEQDESGESDELGPDRD